MSTRILLVEDDVNTRRALHTLLQLEGHVVYACENAKQALDQLNERAYDSMITDLVMPKVNGLTLVRAARALQPNLDCYVVSGVSRPPHGDPDVLAWLSKPLDFDALLALLGNEEDRV